MEMLLLMCGAVILVCILSGRLSDKFGLPSLLLFMVVGMLFGSDGIFKIQFDNYDIAENVCKVALMFIMFYGGFGTKLAAAKPVMKEGICLSTVGVILTAGITTLGCHYICRFDWHESFLIGSVISSTDAASVFSVLRSKRLGLKDNLASMLEVESGSNDPMAYMLTAIALTTMSGDNSTSVASMIATQVFYGALLGAAMGVIATYLFKKKRAFSSGTETIFIMGMVMMTYSAAELIGGNGYLSLYIAGIMIGNADIRNKSSLVHFFDGITDLSQIILFFLLGLLAAPSEIPKILLPSIGIMLILTLVARPIAVFATLTPFGIDFRQQLFVVFSGLRGAASVVFAIMAMTSDAYMKSDIFHIVFCVSLLSVAFQGTLLPWAAKKLDIIDDSENVLKTFNDYRDEAVMHMMRVSITEDHPWCGECIKDIILPPDSLVLMIKRRHDRITPDGSTMLAAGDELMISISACDAEGDFTLREIPIGKRHKWCGVAVKDLGLPKGMLAVMVRRGDETLIPHGDTVIKKGDVVVVNE